MIRAYHDNVVIVLEEQERETASGITIVHDPKNNRRGIRTAKVVASGPGYWTRMGKFVENTVQPGQRVMVDALAGQDYRLDLSVPRHNKGTEFGELVGERGEFRIVREQEIHCVIE